jgi:HK97 family phage prohead protease|tara:strand:- start:6640 stop:7986 length:1347 start_codon:yes stop_codon:yes gene_type:complete
MSTLIEIQEELSIIPLEKATDGRVTMDDISEALNEYKRLFKAGLASHAEIKTLNRAYPDDTKFQKAVVQYGLTEKDPMVLGGPASVELVDREGHLITATAMDGAFKKYMKNFRTRNTMVLHSDVQVGWALPAYINSAGQIFKSGVDEHGLFFITELRDDTQIATKVMEQINEGKLKSYSIAGSATKTQTIQKGLQNVMQVDEMELAEVTVCEKGVNQAASFDILKSDTYHVGSCADGSCLIPISKEETSPTREVNLIMNDNGDINFTDSFFQFMKEEVEPLQKIVSVDGDEEYGASFPTLHNTQGRQREHHRLLDEYGFPAEIEPEMARYTPVLEEDPSPFAHKKVPWSVNEAGDNLGIRHYEDALTMPVIGGHWVKPGVTEGGNSNEIPVSSLTKSFLGWVREEGITVKKDMRGEAHNPSLCKCEKCFVIKTNKQGTWQEDSDIISV